MRGYSLPNYGHYVAAHLPAGFIAPCLPTKTDTHSLKRERGAKNRPPKGEGGQDSEV